MLRRSDEPLDRKTRMRPVFNAAEKPNPVTARLKRLACQVRLSCVPHGRQHSPPLLQ